MTARQTYDRRSKAIRALLADIDANLTRHAETFEKEGALNWGWVGDLGSCEDKLDDALTHISTSKAEDD